MSGTGRSITVQRDSHRRSPVAAAGLAGGQYRRAVPAGSNGRGSPPRIRQCWRTSNMDAMPGDSSFDIVSKINNQEVDNALNQTAKEISTRFDFRGVGASIARSGKEAIEIRANSEERANAVLDVFKEKLIKRSVSLKVLDPAEPKPSGKEYRLSVALKEGISDDNARKISKIIRDEGPKGVKAQVQGDELRVSSKKKDELQDVITLLKTKELDLALQFVNYR
jgi:cyclic-di-GMP-binding protein